MDAQNHIVHGITPSHTHTFTRGYICFLGQTSRQIEMRSPSFHSPPPPHTHGNPSEETARTGLLGFRAFLPPQFPSLTSESLSTRPFQLTNQEWAEPPTRANQSRNTAGQSGWCTCLPLFPSFCSLKKLKCLGLDNSVITGKLAIALLKCRAVKERVPGRTNKKPHSASAPPTPYRGQRPFFQWHCDQ